MFNYPSSPLTVIFNIKVIYQIAPLFFLSSVIAFGGSFGPELFLPQKNWFCIVLGISEAMALSCEQVPGFNLIYSLLEWSFLIIFFTSSTKVSYILGSGGMVEISASRFLEKPVQSAHLKLNLNMELTLSSFMAPATPQVIGLCCVCGKCSCGFGNVVFQTFTCKNKIRIVLLHLTLLKECDGLCPCISLWFLDCSIISDISYCC